MTIVYISSVVHFEKVTFHNYIPDPEAELTPMGKMPRQESPDSSFDVNSGDESEVWHDTECATNAVCASSSESECDSNSSSSSEIEVWDESDLEDFKEEPNNSVISSISFFLVFFNLTYRLSERAISTLIGFLRALFHFFIIDDWPCCIK